MAKVFPFISMSKWAKVPVGEADFEIVEPSMRYLDELVMAYVQSQPEGSVVGPTPGDVRRRLVEFLDHAPGGHQPANFGHANVPAYHFWILDTAGESAASRVAGTITLRVGDNEEIRKYAGHLGYHVFPPHRGRRLAERACRLILPLAAVHGLKSIWITANPENLASRTTCHRLGAVLMDIVSLPADHLFYLRGDRQKCRYRLDIR